MKITFLMAFLMCLVAQATDVKFTFNNSQYSVSQYTNIQVRLQPEQLNASGSVTILQPPIYRYTDTNGSTTFSNLAGNATGGYYRWTVPAFTSPNGFNPPVSSQGDIQVNSTNLGLVDSTTIGIVFTPVYNGFGAAWTAQASDLRYSQSSNNLANYVQIGVLISTSNSIVALIPSTNGFVTSGITNGFATTNFAISVTNGFTSIVFSNASAYTTPTQVSNLIASLSNTNQFSLQTVTNVANGVYSNNPSAYVSAGITNGLATTNFVNSATLASTNGLAPLTTLTNYIQSVTNQMATTNWVFNNFTLQSVYTYGTNWVSTNSLAQLNSASNYLASLNSANTNGLNFAIGASNFLQNGKQPASLTLSNLSATGANTNVYLAGQNVTLATNVSGTIQSINATNQTFLTNGITGVAFQPVGSVVLTNQLAALTNSFITAASLAPYATTSYVNSAISGLVINTNKYVAGANVTLTTNVSGDTTYINATNQTFLTNGLASTNFVLAAISASNSGFATLIQLLSTNAANLEITTNLVVASTNNGNIVFTNNPIWTNISANGFNYVTSTNGSAWGLSAYQNLNLGSKTNFLISTNIIGIIDGGSGMGGTYLTVPFAVVWTNTFNITNTVLLSGGNFYLQSNGVSMYQSSDVKTWTIVNGVAPVPSGAFGSFWNMNGVIVQGWLSSTNLTWQITNNIATYPVSLFSAQGSNTIFSIASTVTGPTNGISAATATNIAAGLILTATNSIWSGVTNLGAAQWGGTSNYVAASARPMTIYYCATNPIQYFLVITN